MLEPASGEHTEFTDMVQVVNVKTDPSKEFEITEVTYSHPLGIKIENHYLTWNKKSFRIVTSYPAVVNRGTDYAIKPSELELTFHRVESIFNLPETYEAVYCVDNPPPSIPITYTAKGRERTITQTGDSSSGTGSTSYGPWYDQSYQWIDTVYTNLETQQKLILDAVHKSQAYKKANS